MAVTAAPRPVSRAASAKAPHAQAGQTLLEVAGLSKSFGGLKAVQDVSFTVRAGEILGIIGPNGAGKTTLFNLLNGILQPNRQIDCMGRSLRGLATNRIARLGIGRTFQVARPFPRLSVLDNVVVGAYVATETDEDAYALARAALDKVGLTSAAHLRRAASPRSRSDGSSWQERSPANPSFYCSTRRWRASDRRRWRGCSELIRRLAADGLTIVIIEHTMHAHGAAGGPVHRPGSRRGAGARAHRTR